MGQTPISGCNLSFSHCIHLGSITIKFRQNHRLNLMQYHAPSQAYLRIQEAFTNLAANLLSSANSWHSFLRQQATNQAALPASSSFINCGLHFKQSYSLFISMPRKSIGQLKRPAPSQQTILASMPIFGTQIINISGHHSTDNGNNKTIAFKYLSLELST